MIYVTDDIQLAEHELEFRYVASSGPGGQNVNKTATAAHLHFDTASSALPDDVKRRLRSVAGNRLTGDGMLVIKAQRYRSQDQNRKDAVDRLVSILRRAAAPPRPRRSTRPTAQSVQQRLEEKRQRSRIKQSRAPGDDDGGE